MATPKSLFDPDLKIEGWFGAAPAGSWFDEALIADAAGGAVTGSLSATETGADTFAGSGDVIVSGAFAATESGADTAALSGAVRVSGSLAASESGADSFSGSGKAIVSGSLAVTEAGADTFAASGGLLVSGSLSATEAGADSFSATGSTTGAITGLMGATESGSDSFAGTGTATVAVFGGTKQRRVVGRRDLDAVEQARERERLAHLEAVRKFAEKQAAKAAEQSEPRTPQTVLALKPAETITQRATRPDAQETARVVAAQALADAIALRQQLDDEAAEVLLAYLMAA